MAITPAASIRWDQRGHCPVAAGGTFATSPRDVSRSGADPLAVGRRGGGPVRLFGRVQVGRRIHGRRQAGLRASAFRRAVPGGAESLRPGVRTSSAPPGRIRKNRRCENTPPSSAPYARGTGTRAARSGTAPPAPLPQLGVESGRSAWQTIWLTIWRRWSRRVSRIEVSCAPEKTAMFYKMKRSACHHHIIDAVSGIGLGQQRRRAEIPDREHRIANLQRRDQRIEQRGAGSTAGAGDGELAFHAPPLALPPGLRQSAF